MESALHLLEYHTKHAIGKKRHQTGDDDKTKLSGVNQMRAVEATEAA